MTWKELRIKYSDSPLREKITEEQEKEFVADCFGCYENEGFSKVFWSQSDDFKKYCGQPFEVIGRVPILDDEHPDGADLECLPMWNIRFEDGFQTAAYPEEIIPREMQNNGCPEKYLKSATSGPIPFDESHNRLDLRGIMAYAKGKGVKVLDLSDEEKKMFIHD